MSKIYFRKHTWINIELIGTALYQLMTALINYSEVRTEAKLLPGRLAFRDPAKARDLFVPFCSPHRTDQLWSPSRILLSGCPGFLVRWRAAVAWNWPTHIYIVLRMRVSGSAPPLPYTLHGIFRGTLILLLHSKLFSSKQLWAMLLLDVKWRRKLRIDLKLLYLKFSGKNEGSI